MQTKRAPRLINRTLQLAVSCALFLPLLAVGDEYSDIQNLDEAELLKKLEQLQVLDEIIVTATAREESLQDVPISVITTTGDDIESFTLTNAADLTANLPAITIAPNPIGNFVFIRGIGTPGANQGIEQSVSIFHDGVYMGRHQLSRAPFMDLERVEVLRGPQSILFGKNTIGGAVHVISAKPTDEFEASVSGLYGWEDGERELNTVVSGPLGDAIRGRLAFRKYELDGYLDNILTNNEAPARDDWSVRGQLEFDVTDNLMISTRLEHSDFFSGEKGIQLSIFDPLTPGAAAINGLNQLVIATVTGGTGIESLDDQVAANNDGGLSLPAPFAGLPGFPDLAEKSDNEMDLVSVTFDLGLGEHTLMGITSYAGYEYRDICDCDFSALPFIQVDASEDYEQYSQEFRLTSPLGGFVDYVAGIYAQSTDLEFRSSEAIGTTLAFNTVPAVPPGPAPVLESPLQLPNLTRDYGFDQKQDMWAIFGSATFNFSEDTRLTLGLRYFEEDKEVDHFLDKRFTDGWDFTGLTVSAGQPDLVAGPTVFGNTAADYDQFLIDQPSLGGTSEFVYAGLLGTTEHDIRDRKRSEEGVDWLITLEKDLEEDVLGFATISTGTKGGGFDARYLGDTADSNGAFEYEEEEAINYEMGIKATVLDGAMTLNSTLFYTLVEDYQVSIFDGATAFLVDNAGEIESSGLELEVEWLATEHLTVSFAGALLDATYKKFPNAPCWVGTAANNRGDCSSRVPGTAQFRDASGDRNLFSPEKSFNLQLDYLTPMVANLDFQGTINTNYVDEHFVTADLDEVYARQPSYTTIDLRLAVINDDEGWEVALLGKNLTDEQISVNSNDQPLVPGNGYAQLQRLRSYSIQGIYRFD